MKYVRNENGRSGRYHKVHVLAAPAAATDPVDNDNADGRCPSAGDGANGASDIFRIAPELRA